MSVGYIILMTHIKEITRLIKNYNWLNDTKIEVPADNKKYTAKSSEMVLKHWTKKWNNSVEMMNEWLTT